MNTKSEKQEQDDYEIPVLENEEMWSQRVIDDAAKSSNKENEVDTKK